MRATVYDVATEGTIGRADAVLIAIGRKILQGSTFTAT